MPITGVSQKIRTHGGGGGGSGDQGPWWYLFIENTFYGEPYAVFMIWAYGQPSISTYGYGYELHATGASGSTAAQRAFVVEVYWDSCSYMPADERYIQFIEPDGGYGMIVHRIAPLVVTGDLPYTYVSE